MNCKCFENNLVDVVGKCDTSQFEFNDANDNYWTELSIPEILTIPKQKPTAEAVDKVFISVDIISKRVVKTPSRSGGDPTNAEGIALTGRKVIVEGELKQKIIYTADDCVQSVHSAEFCIPFSTFIVVSREITPPGATTPVDALDVDFCIETCVEDVYVRLFNRRDLFKNVTLWVRAKPIQCDTTAP